MSPIRILLLLLASFDLSFAISIGISRNPGRSILRAITDTDLPDVAVELNNSNFDPFLRESSIPFAIVEFFAHWCPACRNYKPHYEKVARLFNGPHAVHPGIVLMTRVDCALKINTKLCDRFSVGHYPMLLWGPPSKFASGGSEPRRDKGDIKSIDDGRTADRLLNWINQQMSSTFSFDDEKYENEHLFWLNASDPGQVARAIYDVEEATAEAFDIILEHKMIKTETRAPLIRFLQLLVAHHPSKRCRKGTAEILVNFDYLWPSDLWSIGEQEAAISRQDAVKSFRICGKDAPRGYWTFCRGSKNETRGFSCGLWVLLHSLTVRVEDGESHLAFTAICEFIRNFFICEECRQHFYAMCSSVSAPLNTTQSFALWLWGAHNSVNERLMKEEAAVGTGDPKYPKIVWPPKSLCPSCYLSLSRKNDSTVHVHWNKDEAFKFLVGYYGKTLVSMSNEKGIGVTVSDELGADDVSTSTNAVAVPVGAALAIALASCAFGALAWFWRSRQKNRKQWKSRN
ncbi:hypothetical protein AAC387_Pa05g3218 [Persea americana]